jgi:hypothetical protein
LGEALSLFEVSNPNLNPIEIKHNTHSSDNDTSDPNHNPNPSHTNVDKSSIKNQSMTYDVENSSKFDNKLDLNNYPSISSPSSTPNLSSSCNPDPNLKLDLILAADTFIYVGALGTVFAQVSRCLSKNGLFAFSIEDLDSSPMKVHRPILDLLTQTAVDTSLENINLIVSEEKVSQEKEIVKMVKVDEPLGAVPGWGGQLLSSARFAHSDSYIKLLSKIHGFNILITKIVILRTEETIPLHGRLYILELN